MGQEGGRSGEGREGKGKGEGVFGREREGGRGVDCRFARILVMGDRINVWSGGKGLELELG